MDPDHPKEVGPLVHKEIRDKKYYMSHRYPMPSFILIGQIDQPGLKTQSKSMEGMNNCELIIPSITAG